MYIQTQKTWQANLLNNAISPRGHTRVCVMIAWTIVMLMMIRNQDSGFRNDTDNKYKNCKCRKYIEPWWEKDPARIFLSCVLLFGNYPPPPHPWFDFFGIFSLLNIFRFVLYTVFLVFEPEYKCYFLNACSGWPFRLSYGGRVAKHRIEVKKAVFCESTSQVSTMIYRKRGSSLHYGWCRNWQGNSGRRGFIDGDSRVLDRRCKQNWTTGKFHLILYIEKYSRWCFVIMHGIG